MRRFVLPAIIYVIYRLFWLTWRVKLVEPPEMKAAMKNREPFIIAHWHGDELVLVHLAGRYRIATIVSTSKDGDLMNTFFHMMGGRTSRGSSTRGAVGALKGLFRHLREGRSCSFAVDGPKGPLHKVKPGVFEVSRAQQLPIYWCGVACDRAFHFPRSWNKTYFPKPFARIRIEWHGPSTVAKDRDPRDPELATWLEVQLHAAKQQAFGSIAEA